MSNSNLIALPMTQDIKNYAFISYSHKDAKIAQWLQKRLEKYSIPTKVLPMVRPENLPPNNSRNLRPIFMDSTDLTAGILADTLHDNLVASKFLIVVCSPNSAKSDWVSKEVQEFVESDRLNNIIPFVIGGVPFFDSQIKAGKNPLGEECMPKYLVEYTKQHPEKELLGIDLQANGMDKAVVRVASRMLGVSFDSLWNRQVRRVKSAVLRYVILFSVLFSLAAYFFMPVGISCRIIEAQHVYGLPMPSDAMLMIEGVEHSLGSNLDTTIVLKNRPGYYRGRTLPVEFTSSYFDTIRTEINVGFGFTKENILFVRRDDTFAVFAGTVLDQDGNPLDGATVSIKQENSVSDAEGRFRISLPVEEQEESQAVIIEKEGYNIVYRADECPSEDLKYIIRKIEEE